jgi:hypothetical protein
MRMIVVFTTAPESSARRSWSTSNPSSRAASAT